MDYQGNRKTEDDPKKPEKNIEKVVVGEVIQKPKSLGSKFKNVFFGGDVKVAGRYITADVLLPALRNTIVAMVTQGIENLVFGESRRQRPPSSYGPRVQYHSVIPRRGDYRDPREYDRAYLPDQNARGYRRTTGRHAIKDIILASRVDAEQVVESLIACVEQYQVVSVHDLYEMIGLETSFIDQKWGWTYLNNVEIRQVREGYLIDLPPLEEI